MSPPTHVALLRGINVGGHNKVPMATLRGLFEAAGCQSVKTVIQSGNVVFTPPGGDADSAVEQVAAALVRDLAVETPIVVRDVQTFRAATAAHPLGEVGDDPKILHVGFLLQPTPAAVRLDPDRSPPDTVALDGDVVYLRTPRGMARTKYTGPWFDRTLGVPTTFRNWRTIERLNALLR